MDLTERTLSSREIFRGRVVRLRVDDVALPNGHTSVREVVDHPGGVCILALDDQGRAAVVRQYRYVFSRVMTELPAGKREPGEEPAVTARRELWEEVGAEAEEWTDLGAVEMIVVPGVAFDREGNRMGRGRGFYDRLLKSTPRAMKVGVCYDFQMIEDVPVEPHDVKMDCVVSEV